MPDLCFSFNFVKYFSKYVQDKRRKLIFYNYYYMCIHMLENVDIKEIFFHQNIFKNTFVIYLSDIGNEIFFHCKIFKNSFVIYLSDTGN